MTEADTISTSCMYGWHEHCELSGASPIRCACDCHPWTAGKVALRSGLLFASLSVGFGVAAIVNVLMNRG